MQINSHKYEKPQRKDELLPTWDGRLKVGLSVGGSVEELGVVNEVDFLQLG